MPMIPRAPHPDSTIAMLRDPYGFISKTCTRLGTEVFARVCCCAPPCDVPPQDLSIAMTRLPQRFLGVVSSSANVRLVGDRK